MKLYIFDPETGKYLGSKDAELDEWQTSIKGSPSYKGEPNSTFEEPPEVPEEYSLYMESGQWTLKPDPTLDELKNAALLSAKEKFAQKRDQVRFIKLSETKIYGFDCASEDITNFMAAWEDAKMNESTMYKVWLDELNKGVVILTNEEFLTVFKAVRDSQFADYAWLAEIEEKIEACESKEELDNVEIR